MKDWSVPLIGIAVLGALAWSGCQESRDQQAWRIDRDSTLASVKAREDSAHRLMAMAEWVADDAFRQYGEAERQTQQAHRALFSANLLRDSVLALGQAPDTCVPWVALFQREADSLRSAVALQQTAYDTLVSAYTARGRTITLLLTSDSLNRASVDSLAALVGRVPRPKKWVPVVTVGYGAVLSGGVVRTGPSAQVGFRIPF